MLKLAFYIMLSALFVGCNSSKLPTTKYSQYNYEKSYTLEDGQLKIRIKNPLECPLRVWVLSDDKDVKERFKMINPIELNKKSDTLISINLNGSTISDVQFASRLGSVNKEIRPVKLELPFPKGKTYKIIQGNNGSYSHSTDWSKYALDFNLKVNDTICSASDGYVVGVIEKYKYGGAGKKWRPYSNFITIYEPNSGVFTQYVHLVKNGSFVEVGDRVKSGQPIGLSGKTGQTDAAHLHFNCLIPEHSKKGLKSTSYEFKKGYKSIELKRNDIVKNE